MRRERLRGLLEELRAGRVEIEEVLRRLDREPLDRLGFARLDHHRALRIGHPEAVYGPGKPPDQLVEICRRLARRREGFLVTRASEEQLGRLEAEFGGLEVSRTGRIAWLPPEEPLAPEVLGEILVVTAGTVDLPVAEEALVTARALGNPVRLHADVGVAALHRVVELQDELRDASVVVVVAGMDGALASVIGGLVSRPVIAVPTSVGYGAASGGLAALLSMLASCAPGVVVVNVDNGYGAACAAVRCNQAGGTPGRNQAGGTPGREPV